MKKRHNRRRLEDSPGETAIPEETLAPVLSSTGDSAALLIQEADTAHVSPHPPRMSKRSSSDSRLLV